MKSKKKVLLVTEDDLHAKCIQIWLFGTDYEVYGVINNLYMVHKALSSFLPDIILLEGNILNKIPDYALDLAELKPQNIILLTGEGRASFYNKPIYKYLNEPFDRKELLRLLDEIPL